MGNNKYATIYLIGLKDQIGPHNIGVTLVEGATIEKVKKSVFDNLICRCMENVLENLCKKEKHLTIEFLQYEGDEVDEYLEKNFKPLTSDEECIYIRLYACSCVSSEEYFEYNKHLEELKEKNMLEKIKQMEEVSHSYFNNNQNKTDDDCDCCTIDDDDDDEDDDEELNKKAKEFMKNNKDVVKVATKQIRNLLKEKHPTMKSKDLQAKTKIQTFKSLKKHLKHTTN